MSWKSIDKSMKRKRDGVEKVCGNCKRFERCHREKQREKYNFVPECKDAKFKEVKI